MSDGETTDLTETTTGARSAPPVDEYVVRPATDADLAGVAAVYEHYVGTSTATFEEVPPDVGFWRERMASTYREGWPFLVAVDSTRGSDVADERVVGYAYVGWWRPRPAYRFTVETSIYVLPDVAGHGLGRRLLEPVLERATAAGAHEAVAIISSGASPASRRLHQGLGFVEVGVMSGVGFKHGTWLDTAILQKHLRGADGRTSDASSVDASSSGEPSPR